ncbi:MAG: hypothetical protein ACK44P_08960 [Bacteroidota bacterium]|jgi:hypothetical protein
MQKFTFQLAFILMLLSGNQLLGQVSSVNRLAGQLDFLAGAAAPFIWSTSDSAAYNSILSLPRFAMPEGSIFNINNISHLRKLKDRLDILSTNRNFRTDDDVGLLPDWYSNTNCSKYNPHNPNSMFRRVEINFLTGQVTALQPNEVFGIRTVSACNNTPTHIFYVNEHGQFGFGNINPQANYHFSNFDMLVGAANGIHFKMSKDNNRPHLVFANNSDRLFMVNKDGKVFAKEFEVMASLPLPDYVFDADYKLMSISELRKYVSKNKHLPDIKSAAVIEKEGVINLNEMQMTLLKKIEELTLYILQLSDSSQVQKEQIAQLKQELAVLKARK